MGVMSKLGGNKTGLAPGDKAREMTEGTEDLRIPEKGNELGIAKERADQAKATSGVGSMPPPASAKQVGKAAIGALTGGSPNVFVDKLGERLAFERNGTRLYEALLSKLDAHGSFDGGPRREEVEHIRKEELAHFHLLHESIEKLGADPTVMTPSADIGGVASKGITEVLSDARTNVQQSLDAILIAELADNDGWEALVGLARDAGQDELAQKLERALEEEHDHLRRVRAWVAAGQGRSAGATAAAAP